MAPLLEGCNLSQSFQGTTVFENINLTLQAGESLSITGPSGSGKTTLLSILGLLLDPFAGEVRIEGQSTTQWDDEKKSQVRNEFFGFLFQSSQLISSLTVLENVLVPTRLSKGKEDRRAKARSLLEELGLKERMDYLPHQLSIGQKRRVALARALIMDPRVILADEPTNDLDPERAFQVAELLFQLPRRGVALVLVTHDMELAAKADHRVRLAGGTIVNE